MTAADNNPMTPLSSRPPLTPNTVSHMTDQVDMYTLIVPGFFVSLFSYQPGYDGSLHRTMPKRPTVTVLTPAIQSTSPVTPGSRLYVVNEECETDELNEQGAYNKHSKPQELSPIHSVIPKIEITPA